MDAKKWNDRYLDNNVPWDIGFISTPLKAFFDSISDKSTKILIPGGGHSYEAEYLHKNGFTQVFICDWAEAAIENFLKRVPTFNPDDCIIGDFFKIENSFDLIVEQTFFCAISPTLRNPYVNQVYNLLKKKGILVGLFFAKEFEKEGPPYGGTKETYKTLFSEKFNILELEPCQNSISPRNGMELFFKFEKK